MNASAARSSHFQPPWRWSSTKASAAAQSLWCACRLRILESTMDERQAMKSALLEAIAASRQDGTYDDAVVDRIHECIEALRPHSTVPSPALTQHALTGAWRTLFAQFTVKHTAGKPIVHDTDLALQSFKAFPKRPARALVLEQEIHHQGHHYNNVVRLESPDGAVQAHIIVWGRYRVQEDLPQRYFVEFYQAELRALPGENDDDLRAGFGLAADDLLVRPLKPPRLHSDIVYCDDDLRINIGSLGGVYVLRRLDQQPVSVSL
jgi:hypothetical protein